MADEFDIDKIIPKNQQLAKVTQQDIEYSQGSFDLSIKDQDIES